MIHVSLRTLKAIACQLWRGKNGCLDEGRYVWGRGSALASHFGVEFEPLGYEMPWLSYDVQGLALPIVGKEVPRAWREAFLATLKFVYSYQMMKKIMRMGSILDTVRRLHLLMWIEKFRLEMLVPTRRRHMMSASVSIPTESPNAGSMSEPSTISSLPSATLLEIPRKISLTSVFYCTLTCGRNISETRHTI